MQNTKKLIGIFAVAIFIIGSVSVLVFGDNDKNDVKSDVSNTGLQSLEEASPAKASNVSPVQNKTTTQTTAPKTSSTPASSGPASYTWAQVATHNSSSSCWTVVNGAVYDLTSWISNHPGGEKAIRSMCGGDGSEDFNEQHGGDGGPEKILASFKIGVLK